MSSQTQSSLTEIVSIEQLRETSGPRITEIDPEHVADLNESIKLEGLIEPLVVTLSEASKYSYDIVDGRHRKRALEQIGVDELEVYDIPGERNYAVPTKEAQVDVEIQSMAANVLRKEQTQGETARFLEDNVEKRIISNFTDEELGKLGNNSDENYASARVSRPLQLIEHLKNVKEDKAEWKFRSEHLHALKRIRSAINIGEPGTEVEYLRFYTDSPPEVIEAWEDGAITKQYVGHLRQIEQNQLRDHALEKSMKSGENGYSTRDVKKIKVAGRQDAPEVHENIINEVFSDLDNAVEQAKDQSKPFEEIPGGDKPNHNPKGEFEEFKVEVVSPKDREKAKQIADHEDNISTEDVLRSCYEMYVTEEDFQQELNLAVDEIEELERELQRRTEQRKQELKEFDFPADSQFAEGKANHLAPPVETENFGVFFHDVQEMEDEIADEELQLIFTSPPYFTQSDRIVDRWWPEDVEYTPENITEKVVDRAYQNYLDEMQEIFDILHSKLQEGRYLILNISDTKAYGVDAKGYDIPSDLSYLIRHELNPEYESANQFKYDATIAWDKGKSQTHDRNQSFYAEGKPLTFHPNWRYERLLVFRKGERDHPDKGFRLNSREFQPYSDDVWSIENDTQASDHEAGFTVELPQKIIQLYSNPGDTIADVFGGYSTTLFAAKILNEQVYPDEPDWTGYAWENFASESGDQEDYRQSAKQLLTGSLAKFRGEYLGSK